MDGIIIWSDPARFKAIIWCSDHRDLAFITHRTDMLGSASLPEAGTLVSFKSEIIKGQRLCTSVLALSHKVAPDLAHALRELSNGPSIAPVAMELMTD